MGAGIFVVGWVLTALVSMLGRAALWVACGSRVNDCGVDPDKQPLDYVPLVGPMLVAPPNAFNVTSTVVQAGGLLTAVVGLTLAANTAWYRDSPVRATTNGLALAF